MQFDVFAKIVDGHDEAAGFEQLFDGVRIHPRTLLERDAGVKGSMAGTEQATRTPHRGKYGLWRQRIAIWLIVMSKKQPSESKPSIPVSRETAGGVAGAVVGGIVAGPIGAVIGGVAGAAMGNRSAAGEDAVPSEVVNVAKKAVKKVRSTKPGVQAKKAVKGIKRAASKVSKATKRIPGKIKAQLSGKKNKTAGSGSQKNKSSTKRR